MITTKDMIITITWERGEWSMMLELSALEYTLMLTMVQELVMQWLVSQRPHGSET